MSIRTLSLLIIIVFACIIAVSGVLIYYFQKDTNPNFITTPKPKIVYQQTSVLAAGNLH